MGCFSFLLIAQPFNIVQDVQLEKKSTKKRKKIRKKDEKERKKGRKEEKKRKKKVGLEEQEREQDQQMAALNT